VGWPALAWALRCIPWVTTRPSTSQGFARKHARLQGRARGIATAQDVAMSNQHLAAIDHAELTSVTGGAGIGESISNAYQGTKNFVGGAAAGVLHGAEAKTTQVDRFAQTNSRATKAGFEMGAMGNMAMGNFGQALSWGADQLLPGK
jgi:hypothetical protein